jgi:hypothetical protein
MVERVWFPHTPDGTISESDRVRLGIGYGGITISALSTVGAGMLEVKIYSLLSGTTAITEIVGEKIFPLQAPQPTGFPYIIYSRVSGGQVSGLDGYLNLENPRIQIDMYSTSYAQAKVCADTIHDTMNEATDFKSILISDNDLFDDDFRDKGSFRVSMDFSCWNRK